MQCKINLDNEDLEKSNGKARYPLIVDKNGNLIYPVGGRTLTFGKFAPRAQDIRLYDNLLNNIIQQFHRIIL